MESVVAFASLWWVAAVVGIAPLLVAIVTDNFGEFRNNGPYTTISRLVPKLSTLTTPALKSLMKGRGFLLIIVKARSMPSMESPQKLNITLCLSQMIFLISSRLRVTISWRSIEMIHLYTS